MAVISSASRRPLPPIRRKGGKRCRCSFASFSCFTSSRSKTFWVGWCCSLLVLALVVCSFFLEEHVAELEADLEGFQMDQDEDNMMLNCIHDLLLDYLPIGKGWKPRHKSVGMDMVFVHHFDAGNNDKWNQDIRLEPMPILTEKSNKCSVWDVSAYGNAKAADSFNLLKMYPNCKFHVYEPVLPFYYELEGAIKDERRIKPHNYGIGANDTILPISLKQLRQQGAGSIYFNVPEGTLKNETTQIEIKSFDDALAEAGNIMPSLLHVNCKGCEWDMIQYFIDEGVIGEIPVVQVVFHNYATGDLGLGARSWQYCEIGLQLSKTHKYVKGGVPFGWDRWVLREEDEEDETDEQTEEEEEAKEVKEGAENSQN